MSLPVEIQAQMEKIQAIISEVGAELVDTGFRHTGSRRVIVFIVDKAGGIGLDDCSQINRRLCHFFDELAVEAGEGSRSLMSSPYLLEVNSPGLDRPLRTSKDFNRAIDQRLRVIYNDENAKSRQVIGSLQKADETSITLWDEASKTEVSILLERIAKAVREITISKK